MATARLILFCLKGAGWVIAEDGVRPGHETNLILRATILKTNNRVIIDQHNYHELSAVYGAMRRASRAKELRLSPLLEETGCDR